MTIRVSAIPLFALAALTACSDPGQASSASASGSGEAQTTDDGSASSGGTSDAATSEPTTGGSATDATTVGTSTGAPASTSDDGMITGTTTGATDTSGGSSDDSSGTGSEITGCTAAADGCCNNLVAGGTDPDCPALDCDQLQGTTPIELPSIAFPSETRRSGTAMYWSGEALWTARLDWVDANFTPDMVVFERRSAEGDLLEETHAELPNNPATLFTAGPTSLAYHEEADRFMLAYQASSVQVGAAGIDPDGTIAWNSSLPAQLCNGTPSRIEAFSSEAGFIIGVDENPCEGSLTDVVAIEVTADGVEKETELIDFGIGSAASFACGPDCDPVFSIYFDELAARVGMWSPGDAAPTETIAVPSINYGGMRYSASVFNGENFFTLTHEWPNQNARVQARGLWAPGEGWVGPRVTTPIVDLEARPPALLWTGHGYVAAYASYPDLPLGESVSADDHTVVVEHFGLDGTLRDSFELDPGHPGLFPQLAYVDGRVAITWVRVLPVTNSNTPYERYLSFLGCG